MSQKNHRNGETTDWDSYWDRYRKLLMTTSPLFLGLVILILVGYFSKEPVSPILLSLMFFLGGFMGIIIIVRREVPAVLFTITGLPAIVEGSLLTLVFWGCGTYLLLRGLV